MDHSFDDDDDDFHIEISLSMCGVFCRLKNQHLFGKILTHPQRHGSHVLSAGMVQYQVSCPLICLCIYCVIGIAYYAKRAIKQTNKN